MSHELRQVTWRSPEEDKRAVLALFGVAAGDASRSAGGDPPWLNDYQWATRSRLKAPWGDETYGLVAVFRGSRCLGTTAYTLAARGQGILAQVFTDPECRGQGIGSATLKGAVAAFREHGARAVYLAAWEDWKRALYQRVGFRFVGAMGERHAYKLALDPAGEDEALFAAGQQTRIRELGPGDQGDVSALFNARHSCVVKSYEMGCFLGSHFEGEFYRLQRDGQRSGMRALVLDGRETVLGFATVVPVNRRHEEHRGTVDVLVHPRYEAGLGELLEALHGDTPLETLRVYVEDSESSRRRAFETAGYRPVGRLERALRIGSEAYYNLTLYEKRMGPAARGRQG